MTNEFEVNNLSVGMDYLPKEVLIKVNKNICNGGSGGGNGSTTTELDPDIKAAVLPALQQTTDMYREGDFGQVADQTATIDALNRKAQLAQGTLDEGLGTENLLREMRNTEGNLLAGSQGALGSARAGRAQEAALADRSLALSQADLAAREGAANQLGQVAGAGRELEQEVLDKDLRGAERYFGMLAGAPQGTKTTQTGGGK